MEISRIFINDKEEIPIRCDLYVLEKIQDKYGTVEQFERKLCGLYEERDEDEVHIIRKEPNIAAVIFALSVMCLEGIEYAKNENAEDSLYTTARDIVMNATRDYRLLAADIHDEMSRCFSVKKNEAIKKEKPKTMIKKLISNIFKQ